MHTLKTAFNDFLEIQSHGGLQRAGQVGSRGGFVAAAGLQRCYAAATVSRKAARQLPGGFVGKDRNGNGAVTDSYFLIDADGGGPENSIGLPLTDEQMKQQTSFIGWDFENVWTICQGKDYPRLRWEQVQCGP